MLVVRDQDCMYPDRYRYMEPEELSPPAQVHRFDSEGLSLEGWLVQPEGPSKGLVLHAHGNAQNVSAHIALSQFVVERGYSLFAMDYRGFGHSQGQPSLLGASRDVVAAAAYVRAQGWVKPGRLVLFGQSMGAAMAGVAAPEVEPGLVILEAGFGSYPALYGSRYPEARLELSLTASVEDALRVLTCPVGLVHGTHDRVVPFAWQERFAQCVGPGRRFRLDLEGEEHLTVNFGRQAQAYRETLVSWMDEALGEVSG